MGVASEVLACDLPPDEVAAWAAYAPVDALLRPPLAGLDVDALSRDGKLDLAVGLDRLGGFVAAVQARTLASLAARAGAAARGGVRDRGDRGRVALVAKYRGGAGA
ncbi:MAG TPA: hypothetical protein VH594_01655 [Trebonia sp.]